MATWSSCDPCRSCSPHEEKSSEADAEQNMVKEAEDVFRNYVYQRYQTEVEERVQDGFVTPAMQEMTVQQQSGLSSTMQIGRQLAVIGDEINQRYKWEFRSVLAWNALTLENIFESFCSVAERLFDAGINWGQIIALLSFGYRMSIYIHQRGILGFFGRIAKYVAKFIWKNQIAQWIMAQGGWTAAFSVENASLKYLCGIVAVVVLGVAIAHGVYK
ncbi:bcl-2 homologous antagonist/killer [Callorhinchus milii]|uniref:Apoptosis regulator BAK n=1 Tax=Callorhinchus milii TaxID=7868 RepID=V9L3D5_CALMI|nr:bcl-2 homologous antagonist/killer [Callorhinchus milii]XP_042191614.1 bcl-2 homologous antagonist/killer [Callorhinchus milii]|eukprot:gi/632961406/ref/XP_007896738.1/ PREDICTED: bcl-2 homologous antagonist/killer-like [Callorhinchus milii]